MCTKISFNTYLTHTIKLIKECLKKGPCSESLGQICLDGVKDQNKTYSFEVSIGLLPLHLIITKMSHVLKV